MQNARFVHWDSMHAMDIFTIKKVMQVISVAFSWIASCVQYLTSDQCRSVASLYIYILHTKLVFSISV